MYACRSFERNDFLSPENFASGPRRIFEAATRSSFAPEMTRARTAAVSVVTATPRSMASCAVHLPVPFCSAVSSTMSTSGLFVSGSIFPSTTMVISIKKEFNSAAFHSVKTSRISGPARPTTFLMTS